MAQALQTPEKMITPEEARILAKQAPAILREQVDLLPKEGTMKLVSPTPFYVAGAAVGAVLAGATFSKYVKGGWKWVTGTLAAGAAAAGWSAGNTVNKVSAAMNCSLREAGKALLAYADALEKDPVLTEKLAVHLSHNVTAKDLDLAVFMANEITKGQPEHNPVKSMIAGQVVRFGQSNTQFLNVEILADKVVKDCPGLRR